MYSYTFLLQIGLFICLMFLMQGMEHMVRVVFARSMDKIHIKLKKLVIDSYQQGVDIRGRRLLMALFLGLSMGALYGLLAPAPNFMSVLKIENLLAMLALHFMVFFFLVRRIWLGLREFWFILDWAIGIQSRTQAFSGKIIQIKEPEESSNEPFLLTIQSTDNSDVKLQLTRQTHNANELHWLSTGLSVTAFYQGLGNDGPKTIIFVTM